MTTAAIAEPAHAQIAPTQAIQQNYDAVEDFLRKGGVPDVPNVPAEQLERIQTADDLWMQEHRPMPNQPGSEQLHRELRQVRSKGGLLPRAGMFMRGLGGATNVVGLAALAGYTGWQIGTGIRSLFVEARVPTEGPITLDERVILCEEGQAGCAVIKYGTPELPDQWISPLPAEHHDELVGYMEWLNQAHSPVTMWNGAVEGDFGCNQPRPVKPFGTWTQATPASDWIDVWCDGWLREVTEMYGVTEQAVESKPPRPLQPGDNVQVTTPDWAGKSQNEGARSTTLRSELESGRYPTLVNWLDAQLGGPSPDPTGQTVTVPLPNVSETHEHYIQRLQQLGLVGRLVVLSETTADPDFGPGVVVRTNPRHGTRVQQGDEVAVMVNPETVPEPEVPGDPETGGPSEGGGGEPGGGGGGSGDEECKPWVKPELDLSPLNVPVGNVFPFGILVWTFDVIDSWVGDPTAPKLEIPFPGTEDGMTIDLAVWDDGMVIVRGTLLAVSTLLLFWWLATSLLGLSGDRRGSEDSA